VTLGCHARAVGPRRPRAHVNYEGEVTSLRFPVVDKRLAPDWPWCARGIRFVMSNLNLKSCVHELKSVRNLDLRNNM